MSNSQAGGLLFPFGEGWGLTETRRPAGGRGPKPAASLPGRGHQRECPQRPEAGWQQWPGPPPCPPHCPHACLSAGCRLQRLSCIGRRNLCQRLPQPLSSRHVGAGVPGSSLVWVAAQQPSLPSIPHWPFVAPQAAAVLETEHRAELARLLSSLEAKHREVGAGLGLWVEPGLWP